MPEVNKAYIDAVSKITKSMGQYSPDAMATVEQGLESVTQRVADTTAQYVAKIPGMSTQIGRVAFAAAEQFLAKASISTQLTYSGGYEVLGYATEQWASVPLAYQVTVGSRKLGKAVRAPLQDDIRFRVSSTWDSFIPQASGDVAALAAMFGRSLVTRWSSRRIWLGTTPITINLLLKFDAVYDAYREVVMPCLILQQMALPSSQGSQQVSGTFIENLLVPPGPSPFQGTAGNVKDILERNQDRISIRIGTQWVFNNVIIKEADVVFKNKFTPEGQPTTAEVNVTFETYEIMTKESLKEVYHGGERERKYTTEEGTTPPVTAPPVVTV